MSRNTLYLQEKYTLADLMGHHQRHEVSYDLMKTIFEEYLQDRFELSDREARRMFDPLRNVSGTTRAYCHALIKLESKISQGYQNE
ncbi:hypothetical protein J4228_02495 [Candidatus Woesearchaeota archaeon]|nr:hypothetical protein [Candidatus Woesearchaeota archaeon]